MTQCCAPKAYTPSQAQLAGVKKALEARVRLDRWCDKDDREWTDSLLRSNNSMDGSIPFSKQRVMDFGISSLVSIWAVDNVA